MLSVIRFFLQLCLFLILLLVLIVVVILSLYYTAISPDFNSFIESWVDPTILGNLQESLSSSFNFQDGVMDFNNVYLRGVFGSIVLGILVLCLLWNILQDIASSRNRANYTISAVIGALIVYGAYLYNISVTQLIFAAINSLPIKIFDVPFLGIIVTAIAGIVVTELFKLGIRDTKYKIIFKVIALAVLVDIFALNLIVTFGGTLDEAQNRLILANIFFIVGGWISFTQSGPIWITRAILSLFGIQSLTSAQSKVSPTLNNQKNRTGYKSTHFEED